MDRAQGILMLVGGLLTVAALVAGGWAVSRTSALKSTLELVILGNEELRHANDDLRVKLTEAEEARAKDRAEHGREIARLEGQMQILSGHLGDRIAEAVVAALPFHLTGVRDPGARTRATDRPTRKAQTP